MTMQCQSIFYAFYTILDMYIGVAQFNQLVAYMYNEIYDIVSRDHTNNNFITIVSNVRANNV